jgi:hypothetical protein
LRFYNDASLNDTVELIQHVARHEQGFDIRALIRLLFDMENKLFLALVSWSGFEEHDNTWEQLAVAPRSA